MNESLFSPSELHQWVNQFWLAAGSNPIEAQQTADHLIGANLAGHDSHGIGMVPRYTLALLVDELKLNQTVAMTTDSGPIIAVDGKRGMGQAVAFQAMEIAIERAKQHGVCIMGLRHSHHLGRVGHWAEQAVGQGMVSIHFTNAVSQWWVAPHGGKEARFVTNPFTVGIPRQGTEPILLDFATSAIAHGKVRVAYNKGIDVPPHSLIDAQGNSTLNPGVLFEQDQGKFGALVTAGGHKGYALSMVCELLGAALIGGETTTQAHVTAKHGIWNNMLTIVLDPNKMGHRAWFETQAREFIEWVQSSELAPGFDAVLMPGDPERISRKKRADLMPIDDETVAQLDNAAASINQKFASRIPAVSSLAKSN
jgi:hydroxycarboxylate dehydrogenase B